MPANTTRSFTCRFVAGRNDTQKPYGTARSVRASVPDSFRQLADADTDNSQYGLRRPYDWAVRPSRCMPDTCLHFRVRDSQYTPCLLTSAPWAQVIKLDSAIGDRVGYFGRYSDYNNPDFIMNTAGARCTSPVTAGLCMHSRRIVFACYAAAL